MHLSFAEENAHSNYIYVALLIVIVVLILLFMTNVFFTKHRCDTFLARGPIMLMTAKGTIEVSGATIERISAQLERVERLLINSKLRLRDSSMSGLASRLKKAKALLIASLSSLNSINISSLSTDVEKRLFELNTRVRLNAKSLLLSVPEHIDEEADSELILRLIIEIRLVLLAARTSGQLVDMRTIEPALIELLQSLELITEFDSTFEDLAAQHSVAKLGAQALAQHTDSIINKPAREVLRRSELSVAREY